MLGFRRDHLGQQVVEVSAEVHDLRIAQHAYLLEIAVAVVSRDVVARERLWRRRPALEKLELAN